MRFPDSVLLMPQAAQRMVERTLTGNFLVLNSHDDYLSFWALINVLPLSICGGGSLVGFNSPAETDSEKKDEY